MPSFWCTGGSTNAPADVSATVFLGVPCLLLHTVGAKSGAARTQRYAAYQRLTTRPIPIVVLDPA
jgi:hypothetical protein